MYNRRYRKQFGFCNSHSTDQKRNHWISQPAIIQIWEKQIYVGHLCRTTKNIWHGKSTNCFKKLKLYGVTGKNYSSFKNYLTTKRKQCIVINDNENTSHRMKYTRIRVSENPYSRNFIQCHFRILYEACPKGLFSIRYYLFCTLMT